MNSLCKDSKMILQLAGEAGQDLLDMEGLCFDLSNALSAPFRCAIVCCPDDYT